MKQSCYILRIMVLGCLSVCCLAGGGSDADQSHGDDLLTNGGFERFSDEPIELDASGYSDLDPGLEYFEHLKVSRSGEYRHVDGWDLKCFVGKVRFGSDEREVVEGSRSLKLQFVDLEAISNGMVGQRDIAVTPNTAYKLEGRVKPYQVDWVLSHCRFDEYAEGDEPVATGHRRMITYPTSRQFQALEVWYVTGPATTRLSFQMHWRGRPRTVGIVRRPSMVWLDDVQLIEVGSALSPAGDALYEGFEGDELENWWRVRPGASWQQEEDVVDLSLDPHISSEEAHSGSRSLKLSGDHGAVERVFAERLTDCVVTLWYRDDEIRHYSHTRMFLLVDERRSVFPHAEGSIGVGLGDYRESKTHFSWFPGPFIPCPYCGRKAHPGGENPNLVTTVARTPGWHELRWDVSEGEGIVFAIDGEEVGRTDQLDGFRILQLGEDFWNGSDCYVDDIRIELKGNEK